MNSLKNKKSTKVSNALLKHVVDAKPIPKAVKKAFVAKQGNIEKNFNEKLSIPKNVNQSDYLDFKNKNLSRDDKINIFHKFVKDSIIPEGSYVLIQVYGSDSEVFYTLTNNNKNDLLDLIDASRYSFNDTFQGSDSIANLVASNDIKYIFFRNISIDNLREKYNKNKALKKSLFTGKRKYKKTDGSFFNYKHLIDNEVFINQMHELQIFHTDENIDYSDNCFIKSLRGQLEDTLINKLKGEILTKNIVSKDINKIVKDNDLFITLYKTRPESNKRIIEKYGNKDSVNTAIICLTDNHYYKYIDDIGFTMFFLKNHDSVYEITDCHKTFSVDIVNGKPYYKKSDKRYTDSFKVVNFLINNKDKYLKHIDVSEEIINDPNCLDTTKLPDININDHCREIAYKPKKEKNYIQTLAFDFETYCDENGKHVPYLVNFCTFDNSKKKSFYGVDCARQFLNYLISIYGVEHRYESDDNEKGQCILMYAHNMTYDVSFLYNELTYYKLLEKDELNVSVEGLARNKDKRLFFMIKDSWRLIPNKLIEFNSMFDLDTDNKEVMYYDMYNQNSIDHIESMTKKELDSYIKTFNDNSLEIDLGKEKQFYENLKKWNCINDDKTYDLLKYSNKYCELDVEILIKGLKKFHDLWKDLTYNSDDETYINIHNFFSLPSLANEYFKSKKCFDDCYDFSGILSSYFLNFQHGGRVMVANNKKMIIDDGNDIQDFDGVSLYPSAMHFMDGYAKGLPKIIKKDTSIETIMKYDYYFIKVKLLKVNIHRSFPLLNVKTKEGIKNWTDKLDDVIYFFDRYQLEDAIKFHNIKFEFIEGYYFNEGFNKTINTEIKTIFDARAKAKKEKNMGLSNLLKLIMNSSYGKLGQRPSLEKIEIVKNSSLNSFINYNYNSLISASQHDGDKFFKCKLRESIDKSYSSPHQSCIILSRSKRIMNEVMCLAEDNNINLFYQDTDSIHMYDKDVIPLSKLYMETYNKELIGKNLGQFHSDFDVPDSDYINPVSKRFIALGKKCYYDQIEATHKITGKKKLFNHIRLKGVTTNSILYKAKEEGKSVYDIYKILYKGKTIEFDLSVDNKARFQKSNGQYYRGEILKRNINFKKKKNNK